MLKLIRHKTARVHAILHHGEHWTHAVYCGVLYVEGHGVYATVGGVLGALVVVNLILGGDE